MTDTPPHEPEQVPAAPNGDGPGARSPGSAGSPNGAAPAAVPSEGTVPDDAGPAGAGPYEEGEETDGPGGRDESPSLRAGLEAILMVVDEPVPEVTLAQILERPRHEVAAALSDLAAEYTAQGRGFELRQVAGGWRFYTRETCAPLVERFVRDGQQARLTQAALETLAVVAYRQPVSRARVAAIRGVNSDGVIRTLTLRGLIEEAGHDPEHQAVLYRTTAYFLERLGLNSLDELPDLAPYLPDDVEGIEELQQ
jgi:segregation and condensation protein B